MIELVIALTFLAVIIMAVSTVHRGTTMEADLRRETLLKQARFESPGVPDSDALGILYTKILREIVAGRKTGRDVSDLEDDLFTISDQQRNAVSDEVDTQSAFIRSSIQ